MNMEGGSGDPDDDDEPAKGDGGPIEEYQFARERQQTDFEAKNLAKLEAMAAQKALEKKQMEEARAKMKRR
jgi:hypothetical protein